MVIQKIAAMCFLLLSFPALCLSQVIFSEDFEGSTMKLTVTNGGWEQGIPTYSSGPTTVPQGNKCVGTVLGGDYGDNSNYTLTTPSITLGSGSYTLSFNEWISLESCCDRVIVEINQSNNGWIALQTTSTSTSSWTLRTIDLSSYRSSSIQLRFRLTSDGSVVNPGWYIDNMVIFSPEQKNLTVQSDGNGSTTPSGTQVVTTGVQTSISASPSSGYRFQKWTVISGTVAFLDSLSQSTSVTIFSDATIRAQCTQATVYSITGSAVQYSFKEHYYSTQSDGVRMCFIAPSTGTYYVVLDTVGNSYKYLYYYGNDSLFSTYQSYQYGNNRLSVSILATTANQKFYFKISPYSSSYYNGIFKIHYENALSLTLSSSGNGTVSPVTPISLQSGQTQSITATPAAGYRFKGWHIVSGTATITDSTALSTSVTITSNCNIRADFIPGTVYPIESTPDTFNFTANYFSVSPSNGVRMCFNAPAAGQYNIVLDTLGYSYKYLYSYGNDSLFGSIQNNYYGNGQLSASVTATGPNQKFYFSIVPSGSSYYTGNYIIRYGKALSLSLTSNGNGVVTPSIPVNLTREQQQIITATPSTNYRFNGWHIESGTATITDSTAMSTTVSVNSNTVIRANFEPGTVYPINAHSDTFNFTKNYYSVNPSNGVRMCFTAPAAGAYFIVLDTIGNSTKYLYSYEGDSLFGGSLTYQYGNSRLSLSVVATTAGQKFYFRAVPYSSSYYTGSFIMHYENALALSLTSTGSGTVSPNKPIGLANGQVQSISATPNTGYRFNGWHVVSGSASIADSTALSTTVTISSNAEIHTDFTAGSVYPIISSPDTFNFTNHYYSGSPSSGVRMLFTAPVPGAYSIILDTLGYSYKYLYNYGNDSTFYNYQTYQYGYTRLILNVVATQSGQKFYFLVTPSGSSYYKSNYIIKYENAMTLTVSGTGSGTVSPSQPVGLANGQTQTITAAPNTGYRSTGWHVHSGSATIADSLALSTTVTITSNTEIHTDFVAGTIYPIESNPDTLNFTSHYYSISPSNGVRMCFTSPGAGTYYIILDTIGSSYKYLYSYGSDSTFGSSLTYQYGYGRLIITVTPTVANQKFYFSAVPSGSSYYKSNFIIRYGTDMLLTVNSSGNGTTAPSGQTTVQSGVPQAIIATPNDGYRLRGWHVESGNATIADSLALSTTVTITSNTVIRANFEPGTVYPIDATPDTFNFMKHYYSVSPGNGVRMCFTAPAAGTYTILLDTTGNSYKYMYYYGTDSLFSSYITYYSGSGQLVATVTATTMGQKFYFRISPSGSSYYNANYIIKYATPFTLSLRSSGNGTVYPSTAVSVAPGQLYSISASPNSGYRFKGWHVENGTVSITDSTALATVVTVSNNSTIRADFEPGTVYPIDSLSDTLNFTKHYYSMDPSNGVRMCFTAPATGAYSIILDTIGYSYKYMYSYENDSLFGTYQTYQYGYTKMLISVVATNAGQKFYFRIVPSSSSYNNGNFIIHYERALSLTINATGNGTISPNKPVGLTNGQSQSILATPSTGYRFTGWHLQSGTAVIADSNATSTSVTITSNTVISTEFVSGIVYPIDSVSDTFNFTKHYYSISQSYGVRLCFTAPAAGAYAISLDTLGYSYKYFYNYGNDSLFNTSQTYQYGYSRLIMNVAATAPGQKFYFLVSPSGSSYYNGNFKIKYEKALALTVTSSGNGSVTPSTLVSLASGQSQAIVATPNTGYRFTGWHVISGSAIITDSMALSTSVIVASDATVRADFAPIIVYNITRSPVIYNFTTHASATFPENGIRACFTAPLSGAYMINFDTSGMSYKYVYNYGTDSLCKTALNPIYGAVPVRIPVYAESAGVKFFFDVKPYSSSYYTGSVKMYYDSTAYTLTLLTSGSGSTRPSGHTATLSGSYTPVKAIPRTKVDYFIRWAVSSGNATISSSTSDSTQVYTVGDATITAEFGTYTHDTLIVLKNSQGTVFPRDTILLRSGYDTLLTALPYGGHIFRKWSKVQGSVLMTDSSASNTNFYFSGSGGGKALVKAEFDFDPAVRPTVNITDLNISSHPDICVTASVTDTSGRSIVGLDTSAFVLTQDGDTVDYQLTTIANMQGVSVALVIDHSGSMGTSQMSAALDGARQYVRTMTPFDRCAIVSFNTVPTVVQTTTSDTALLISGINSITSSGGTSIIDGTYGGIEQLINETNSRTVIVFSDGINENSNTHDLSSTIAFAKSNNVTIYSIGIGSSADRTMLGSLADSTGGYYSAAPSASALAQLYAQIKSDIAAHYILCYQSPDVVFNGDTHSVVINVNVNNRNSADTAYWNEDNQPPVVTLTTETMVLVGVNQPSGVSLPIRVHVTDDGIIDNVRCFYRKSSIINTSYTEVTMTHVSGDIYQVVLPSSEVVYPGIDFYVLASDNYHLIGRSPNVLTPESQPYVIPVANEVPVVEHDEPSCLDTNATLPVLSHITDADGTFYAVLYYKKGTETFFTHDTMVRTVPDSFQAIIPASFATSAGLDYYIRAVDNVGAATRYPTSGTISLNECTIGNNAPVANAGKDTLVFATATCLADCKIDGSRSSDPDGNQLTYKWYSASPFDSLSGVMHTVSLSPGNYVFRLVVKDPGNLSDTDTVHISVKDTISPTPDKITLPVLTAECQLTVSSIPTATDGCSGTIDGTTSDPLLYTRQGTYTIHWKYTDSSGNVSSQNQTVLIKDTKAPVPDISVLPKLVGECQLTVSTFPTATDGCSGFVRGITTDPLTFNAQGTYTIHWKYTDSAGNVASQNQIVEIKDTEAPVPDLTVLPDLFGNCQLTVSTTPTATDACSGVIGGTTTDPLTYTAQGNYTIHWKYTDIKGNTVSQEQKVVIADTAGPVPDKSTLPKLSAQCQLTVSTIPTATDSCSGKIKGTTTDPLTYSTQGTYTITWKYLDNAGNETNQKQTVVIKDTKAPVPEQVSLKEISGQCQVAVTDTPVAIDECAGIIKGKTADPLQYDSLGTFLITWHYDDKNGNVSDQTQRVIIKDTIPPVPEIATLKALKAECSVQLVAPYANDNCAGRIRAVTTSPMVITAQGSHEIIWTYDDGHGNKVNQKQSVVIKDTTAPHLLSLRDTSIFIKASESGRSIKFDTVTAMDNCSAVSISAVRSDGLSLNDPYSEGTTTVTWTGCDGNGNCDSVKNKVLIKVNKLPAIQCPNDTIIYERESIRLYVHATDPDSSFPQIKIDSLPVECRFIDSANGTGVFEWIPDCMSHGTHTFTATATDGVDTVADSFSIIVNDINFEPVFDSVGNQVVLEEHQLAFPVMVRDCDGTVPTIKIINAPKSAVFSDNHDGTGSFMWTPGPEQNGFYVIIFETSDGLHVVRDTIIIEVKDVNCYPPDLTLSAVDTTVANHLAVTILATATDRDGDLPVLKMIESPSGSSFKSLEDGTGVFNWVPLSAGTFLLTIRAYDALDSTMYVDKTISLQVEDKNVTGPEFVKRADTTVIQGNPVEIVIQATDPDGTMPQISAISIPAGSRIVDNGDGTAAVQWTPACDQSGKFTFNVFATDGLFSDTLLFNVNVQDKNCAPVILPVSNKNCVSGDVVRFIVQSTDPDNDGTVPRLWTSCDLLGFTFDLNKDGSGEFTWPVCYSKGTYFVTFYATDGYLTDSLKVKINVGMKGGLVIKSSVPQTGIYVMSAGKYEGIYLGQDSIQYSAAPGFYWFEAQASGYRSQKYSWEIVADSILQKDISLKPTIPLMFTQPVSAQIGTSDTIAETGSIAVGDVNEDTLIDLTVLEANSIVSYVGMQGDPFKYTPFKTLLYKGGKRLLSHSLVDYNNDGRIDIVVADSTGKILVLQKVQGTFKVTDTIVKMSGAPLFCEVADFDRDNKKDLIVNREGKNLFVFRNTGSDSNPTFGIPDTILYTTGNRVTDIKGMVHFIHYPSDSIHYVLICSGGILKKATINSSNKLTIVEDVNGAGSRIQSDGINNTVWGSVTGQYSLVVRQSKAVKIYQSCLAGDFNRDKVVDIRDLGRISKAFGTVETDSAWNPEFNVKFSDTGTESIDVRDLSRVTKSFQLTE